ncbi:unnamed protein product [Ixodes pacificus]
MSLICQNFVQNAWKKDLCSNCFKSLSDHTDPLSLAGDSCLLDPTVKEENQKNSVISQLGHQRYISQATTIYESRSLLCHPTWKSCLIQDNNDSYVLLKRPKDVRQEEEPPEDTFENAVLTANGLTQGILKVKDKAVPGDPSRKSSSVVFKEDQVQVIGYGGDDYDSDEGNWEMSSDDDDLSLDSLDSTEEEKVITKITRENTDFNSHNENLLRDALALPVHVEAENTSEEPENSSDTAESPTPWGGAEDRSRSPCEMFVDEVDGERSEPPPQDPKVIAATLTDSGTAAIYEARSSFLHSITRSPPLPSAVYTPASDLFIHRGSTSSSSSSEDEVIKPKPKPQLKPKIPVKPAHVVHKEPTVVHAAVDSKEIVWAEKTPLAETESSTDSKSESKWELKPDIKSELKSESKQEPRSVPKLGVVSNGTNEPHPVAEFERTVVSKPDKPEERSIYYAVSEPFSSSPKAEARNPNLHFSEGNIYQEVKSYQQQQQQQQQRRTPQDSSKEIKLAALAVELEQARYNNNGPCKRQAPAPPMEIPEQSSPRNDSPPAASKKPSSKGAKHKSNNLSSECLQQEDGGKNGKKGIFSFKKLLKRGKDGTTNGDDQPGDSPNNPKAWKNADRSRLLLHRLDIRHPMDLAMSPNGEPASSPAPPVVSTPPPPVRVLEDGMYEGVTVEKYGPVPLPADCKNVQQIWPRTPSPASWSRTGADESPEPVRECPVQSPSPDTRPGKPPPPPQRCKNNQSPPRTPPMTNSDANAAKPVVPRRLFRPSMKSEKSDYANLADDVRDWISGFVSKKLGHVRSPMAPKKPHRSSSLVSSSGENSGEEESSAVAADDNAYETIGVRHASAIAGPPAPCAAQEEELYSNATSALESGPRGVSIPATWTSGKGDKPPGGVPMVKTCPDQGHRKWEWHTLESSYAAITASVHEALSKYLAHMCKCSHSLPWESKSRELLRWEDFEVGNPSTDSGLLVYHGNYRETSSPVTLLAFKKSRQVTVQAMDHRTVLSFVDSSRDALVVVLPRGTVTSVGNCSLHTSPQHVAYILLQLIGTLESLQCSGVTRVDRTIENCWLAQWDEHQPQLVYLHCKSVSGAPTPHGSQPSLCQHVQATLLQLLRCSKDSDLSSQSGFKIFGIVMELLVEEKPQALSWAKLLLQYYLWAPWALLKRSWPAELTSHLQRWLDIERAGLCKRLSNRIHLDNLPCSVFLEHQAAFLVNASARSLAETSLLLNDKGYFRVHDPCTEELYQDRMLTPL